MKKSKKKGEKGGGFVHPTPSYLNPKSQRKEKKKKNGGEGKGKGGMGNFP